jgi:hypothetical protein
VHNESVADQLREGGRRPGNVPWIINPGEYALSSCLRT